MFLSLEMFLFSTDVCLRVIEKTPCFVTSYNYLNKIRICSSHINEVTSPCQFLFGQLYFWRLCKKFEYVNKQTHTKHSLQVNLMEIERYPHYQYPFPRSSRNYCTKNSSPATNLLVSENRLWELFNYTMQKCFYLYLFILTFFNVKNVL